MSQQQIQAVRRCWAELDQKPPKASLELFHEDVVIQNPPEMPMPGPFNGHAGVRVWLNEMWDVFDDLHHEVKEILEGPDGKTVVTVQHTKARMRHTELPVDVPWAAVWLFKEGKIWRAQGYMRRSDAVEAAGLSE